MNRSQRGVVVFLVAVSIICAVVWPGECSAAMTESYYVVLDDVYELPLSEQQYAEIKNVWNSVSAGDVLEMLKSMFGADKIPAEVKMIKLRVRTYIQPELDTQPELPKSGTLAGSQGASDFIISEGKLIRYNGTDREVTIPDTVTSIFQGAFYGNTTVKKIIVPASVRKIESFAFQGCSSLKYIVFSGKCSSVGDNMIYRCDALNNVVAPKNSKEYKYAVKKGIPALTSDKPSFEEKTIHQLKGDSVKLKLFCNINAVTWKSSRKSIVSVSAAGRIKCKKAGSAKITAAIKGKKYSLTVKVSEKSEESRVNQIIRTVIRKGMTAREKIKAVHDWFIQNVKYDYYNYLRGTVPHVSHTANGALLRGIAVCDGYSKGFQKVMDKLGIPCQMVTGYSMGGGHAWNRVKVDGKWYYIDVTFDDPIVNGKNTNTTPRYTYFLKTAKKMRKDHEW